MTSFIPPLRELTTHERAEITRIAKEWLNKLRAKKPKNQTPEDAARADHVRNLLAAARRLAAAKKRKALKARPCVFDRGAMS